MLRAKTVIVIALIFLPAICLGFSKSQREAMELLKVVSETYRNLKSYYLEGTITLEIQGPGLQHRTEISMVLAAVKPGKMRAEIKDPMRGMLTLSDGQVSWTYLARLNQYIRKPVAPVRTSTADSTSEIEPHSSLQGTHLADEYERIAEQASQARILGEELVDLEGKSVLCTIVEVKLKPRLGSLDVEPSTRTLWIEKNRSIVLRETSATQMRSSPVGPIETMKTITFSLAKMNEPISDAMFVFTPPEEAKEVEELSIPGMKRADLGGKEAGDFTLKDLEGKQFTLQTLRGKIVLLDFWASWCKPCREEMPAIERLHRQFKDKGLVVLGINDEDPEIARQFLKKHNYTFPMLADTQREVWDLYHVEAIPTIIMISREGKILTQHVGSGRRTESDLRAALKKAGID